MDNTYKKPLFSIVTATYNRAHLLPRAINSVLNQSYQNFEFIIIDDGSSDNTEEVIRAFKDERIIYCKYKQNKGLSVVWNKGLDLARGDYVAILDDDDELLPEALETAVNKFAELSPRGIKVIWFDGIDFVTKKVTGKGINKDAYISYGEHLCRRISGDFWVVLNRSLLLIESNRFDERTWGGSALLWYKFYHQTKVFHVAKVLCTIHREHGSTISNDFRFRLKHKEKNLWTYKIFLKEHGQELRKRCPSVYGNTLGTLGLYQILNGEKGEGKRTLLKSLKFRFSFKTIILILLSSIFNENQITFLAVKFSDLRRYYIRRSR